MSLPLMLQDTGETWPVSYSVKGYLMQWYNSLLTRRRFFPCSIPGCHSFIGSCFVPCGCVIKQALTLAVLPSSTEQPE